MYDAIRLGERAAFFGRPRDGLEPLLALVGEEPVPAPVQNRARWLAGICALAIGEHAQAIEVLTPATRPPSDPHAKAWSSHAASALASVHRQVARYAEARELDLRARGLAGSDDIAVLDALIGLAADAVGNSDARMAAAHLDEAERLLQGWRAPIRLLWVRTEIAWLMQKPPAAVEESTRALSLARRAQAPRHVGKSALFHAAALVSDGRPGGAERYARIALRAVDEFGLDGLRWPVLAVLSDALAAQGKPDAAVRAECAAAITAQAARLPDEWREEWVKRPEVRRRALSPTDRVR